mgnify:CR=1 FL=1
MNEFTLREYKKSDALDLMRMWRETAHLWPMGAPHPTEIGEKGFNNHIEGGGSVKHWVVIDNAAKRIAGYCAFSQNSLVPENMEVSLLNTHPDWQGKGIASVLLHKVAEAARENGISTLTAYTMPTNKGMIKLFKKLPYKVNTSYEDDMLVMTTHFHEPVQQN